MSVEVISDSISLEYFMLHKLWKNENNDAIEYAFFRRIYVWRKDRAKWTRAHSSKRHNQLIWYESGQLENDDYRCGEQKFG